MKRKITTRLLTTMALLGFNIVIAQTGNSPFSWRMNYNSYAFDDGFGFGCYYLTNKIVSSSLLTSGEMVLAGTRAHNDNLGIDCYNMIEVSKFNNTGQVTATYQSPNSTPSNSWEAIQMVTSVNDDIYLTGSKSNGNVLIKLNSDLVKQWSVNFNSIGGTFIQPDPSGNIVLAFVKNNPTAGNKQIVIRKFNSSDGNVICTTFLNDKPNAAIDQLKDLKVDRSGNIYACGSVNSNSLGSRFLAVKLDNGGIIQWRKYYDGQQANTSDIANAIAIDKNLNMIVTGMSRMNNEGFNVSTLKFYQNGTLAWVRQKDFNHDDDKGLKVNVDGSNNIYVLAQLPSASYYLNNSSALIKYDSNGNLIFSNEFPDHNISDLTVSNLGVAYLVGQKQHFSYSTFNNAPSQALLKIGNTGQIRWDYIDTTMTYTGMTIYQGYYNTVLLNKSNNELWVTGGERHQYQLDVTYNWLVSFRGAVPRSSIDDNITNELNFYPNPATDQITISGYNLTANAQLTILDFQGREVINKTLTSNDETIDVSELTVGVYFARFTYEGNIITKKFVKE